MTTETIFLIQLPENNEVKVRRYMNEVLPNLLQGIHDNCVYQVYDEDIVRLDFSTFAKVDDTTIAKLIRSMKHFGLATPYATTFKVECLDFGTYCSYIFDGDDTIEKLVVPIGIVKGLIDLCKDDDDSDRMYKLLDKALDDVWQYVSVPYTDGVRLEDGWWVDSNYNKWIAEAFTEEEALWGSSRLKDCAYCTNCCECVGCRDCVNCIECTDCYDCVGCFQCKDCRGCHNCDKCFQCIECTQCEGCEDCDTCNCCANSTDCHHCNETTESKRCHAIHYGDRLIECIGCVNCSDCEKCQWCEDCCDCKRCVNVTALCDGVRVTD